MWSSNHFSTSSCFLHFSMSNLFRVQVFQGPGSSGSGSRVRVQVLEVAMQRSSVKNFNEIFRYSFLIIQNAYKLDKKYKSIHANKYILLTKYDKKYEKKYGVVIQCDNNKEVSQYKFLLQYSDAKRVYNVIITEGKVVRLKDCQTCVIIIQKQILNQSKFIPPG